MIQKVLDVAELTDSVIEHTLNVSNLQPMLERTKTNPTSIFVNKILDNSESRDTLQSAALATLIAMQMADADHDMEAKVGRLRVALATWAYFGYQLAQAQLAETPQHTQV